MTSLIIRAGSSGQEIAFLYTCEPEIIALTLLSKSI